MIIKEQEPLSLHTTFKIGGVADFFIIVETEDDVKNAVIFAEEKKLPVFFLGKGSNTLFSDEGFRGVVIQNNIKHRVVGLEDEKTVKMFVGAGEEWDEFVSFCVEKKIYGLENLSLIPGSVGASVVQNIGAYGVEVKDFILRVRVFDCVEKRCKELSREECLFDYRYSVFKTGAGKNFIVLGVHFILYKKWESNVSYKDLKILFGEKKPEPKEVRDAVIQVRQGKFPDLLEWGTAGSYFKNPIISKEESLRLQAEYPLLPVFDVPEGKKKISVAWIFDQVLRLKGYKEGKVFLFDKQPLILTVEEGATASDVKKFVEKIKKLFFEKTNIVLEEEVVLM